MTVASAVGTIIRFENDGINCVIKTESGEALLDINSSRLRLSVGDRIQIYGAEFYVTNGHIVAVVDETNATTQVVLNGYIVVFRKAFD